MTSLRVDNLPPDTTSVDLAALFRQHGPVAWAEMGAAEGGPLGGRTGYVDLPAAVVAITVIDGSVYQGRMLRVRRIRPGDGFGRSE